MQTRGLEECEAHVQTALVMDVKQSKAENVKLQGGLEAATSKWVEVVKKQGAVVPPKNAICWY